MDMELMDLRDTLSYESRTGKRALTKVEKVIIEIVNELFESAYPEPPGLSKETLRAMATILLDKEFCDCCEELKDSTHWDGLYGCCSDCSHCQSLEHSPCCHRTCEVMTDKDRRFIESRRNTLEAKKWLFRMAAWDIEDIKVAISELPKEWQVKAAIGIAGTQRHKLLLP